MGTHESGPSFIKSPNETKIKLKDHLLSDHLPFLFKVLSVQSALSIQAHPDLELARELHLRDPVNYKDSNHKPEMAIALTDFEALCGFRVEREIARFAKLYPPFMDLIGHENVSILKHEVKQGSALKQAFTRLMTSSKEQITQAVGSMQQFTNPNDPNLQLFNRLNQQYPNDVGVFCVFFLNFITLKPGQAVFLAANEPHAYLSGNCIECMATSDNVVRAGLTPKHRDVNVLCSMLTYKTFDGIDELLNVPTPVEDRPCALLYKSPVPEFSILKIELKDSGEVDHCDGAFGRSILLCTEGSATLEIHKNKEKINMSMGSVVYLPTNCKYSITNNYISETTTVYQAFQPL